MGKKGRERKTAAWAEANLAAESMAAAMGQASVACLELSLLMERNGDLPASLATKESSRRLATAQQKAWSASIAFRNVMNRGGRKG